MPTLKQFFVPFGGAVTAPPPSGNVLLLPWRTYSETPVADPQPVSGGQFRTFTDQASANAARDAANPGDVLIAVGGGTIPLNLDSRPKVGLESAPITVTCDANTWLAPESASSQNPIIAVNNPSRHWHVIKCNFDGTSGNECVAAIRFQHTGGTSAVRAKIHGNTVTNMPHSHIAVQSWFTNYIATPSTYVDVANNFIDGGGRFRATPWYSEGIYIGRGSPAAVDRTNNVSVRNNRITRVTADGIEAKPGTTFINVLFNEIYDIELHGNLAQSVATGALTMHYGVSGIPSEITSTNSTVLGNRVYNIRSNTTNNVGVFPPITVGFGGTTVASNGGWDYDADHFISINGESTTSYGPGTFFIYNNTAPESRLLRVDPRPGAASYTYQYNIPTTEAGTSPDVSFVGSPTGQAEFNSEGPGSALAPLAITAPIGATGKCAASDTPNPYPGFLLADQR